MDTTAITDATPPPAETATTATAPPVTPVYAGTTGETGPSGCPPGAPGVEGSPGAPPPPSDPVPRDERSIADMPFAGGDVTRLLLRRCGVTKAHEIETLGCTGAASYGLTLHEIEALRLGLGGGGVGLPCFVGTDRFCLAHNTVGGLQEGQKQHYVNQVLVISRALTPKEAGAVAFTEAARRERRNGLHEQVSAVGDMLSGYGGMPRGAEIVEEDEAVPEPLAAGVHDLAGFVAEVKDRVEAFSFICPEHKATNWSCRFCVAQMIVEEALEPDFCVHQPEDGGALGEAVFGIPGGELETAIAERNGTDVNTVEVYVLATTMTRKLSR